MPLRVRAERPGKKRGSATQLSATLGAACCLMWPADPEEVLYYVLRRFPYTIHHEVASTGVVVLAVAGQRRRPGCWQER
jgi:hypothetical protein